MLTRRTFMLAAGAGAAAGWAAETQRPSPEFVIRHVNGQQTLLSSFKGRVIALEFLHTTCPHCQQASTLLEKLGRDYGPKGFQPLGVAFNDMAALLVPDYVKMLRLTFPVGIAPRQDVQTYLAEPFRYVPIMVFIDRNFQIRGQYSGDNEFFKNEEANVRAMIEKLLKEPSASARSSRGKRNKNADGVSR